MKRPLSPAAQQAARVAEQTRFSVRCLLANEPSVTMIDSIGYYAFAANFLRIRRERNNLPDPKGSIEQLVSMAKRRGLNERILRRITHQFRFELPEK